MNQMVRLVPVTADSVCADLQDSIKMILSRKTLSLDEALFELAHAYRNHMYVAGTFSEDCLSGLRGICFIGTICGERRTVTVF